MPSIDIRQAAAADIPELLKIEHAYETMSAWQMDRNLEINQVNIQFREIRLPRAVHMEYPRTLDYFSEESFRTAIILVALLNGVPVAYERLKEEFEPCTLWVKDLAVRKEVRRQGIASVLLLAAQDWASQRNLKRVIVEIQSKNASAIKLVNKLGYEFCGYQDHYFANQDIALFFMRYLR